jgi:hypothetical protein
LITVSIDGRASFSSLFIQHIEDPKIDLVEKPV